MKGVDFPVRFLCDEHFIKELLLKDKTGAMKTILKLSEIHKNSKHYPMEHNLIPDECFKNSIADKEIRGPAIIGAFHPEPWPNFVSNESESDNKLIRYAINIASKKPYRVIILTSEVKKNDYESNKHYSNNQIKSAIRIFSGLQANQMIDIVYRSLI